VPKILKVQPKSKSGLEGLHNNSNYGNELAVFPILKPLNSNFFSSRRK